MIHSLKRIPIAASILLAVSSPLLSHKVLADPGDPIGGEFLVNTEVFGRQGFPSIAMDIDGDFVITWSSNAQDGDVDGIFAQRYKADGTADGVEFQVNTEVVNNQSYPSIAMDADGNFVIAWNSINQDGSSTGIFAQRFQADGTAAGAEFQVNSESNDAQLSSSIAMDADGDFVIAWDSLTQDGSGRGIYAQRYQANGNVAGGEFQVNTETNDNQQGSSIAMDADGNFVIAWSSYLQDGNNFGVYAQRYLADGTPIGGEFLVNTYTNGSQASPSIAMHSDGDFVIAWQSAQDGSSFGIYAQRFQADATVSGNEFQVNTYEDDRQYDSSIAMDASGDFVISWTSVASQDGNAFGVYAQRYQADGTAIGSEFLVNTETLYNQGNSDIAMDAGGNFVVAWESTAQDDRLMGGIYAQRYEGKGDTPIGVDLILTLQDDTDPVTLGNSFVYSLTISNDGSEAATDVNLIDTIPAGLSYVSDDASDGWSCDLSSNTLDCNKAQMAVDEVNTINLTVTADSVGTLSNSAIVNSAEADLNNADNSATETTTVIDNPADTEAPIITLVGDNPLILEQNAVFTDPGSSVTDNVDTDLVATVSGSVDTSTVGTYVLTYNVSDNAGNAATTVQRSVVVVDVTAPVITLLGDNPLTVEQDAVFTDPGSSVTDNVDMGLVATVSGSVDTSTVGTYVLTYNVSDNAGNAAIAVERSVLVVDVTVPVITLLGDNPLTVEQDAVFTDPGSSVTDNVDMGLVATVTGRVDTSVVGTYSLTYSVSDSAGNAAVEVVRNVNVVDVTVPVITLLGDNPMSIIQGEVFTDPGATVTDNVDTRLLVTVTGAVDAAIDGSYTLYYNATDSAGNAATEVTRIVNVNATTTPVDPTPEDDSSSSSSGIGSMGLTSLWLALPLWLRRRRRG